MVTPTAMVHKTSEKGRIARSPPERRADLDWLRVIGILSVFLVHASQVFSPWQVWHIQNETRAPLFGQINMFAFPWLMPVFMLLAGIGAQMSLSRRSNLDYCRDRTLRLVLPFVLGTLILQVKHVRQSN